MIAVVVTRPASDQPRRWQEFLELTTSLAMFGQPVRLVIMSSANNALRSPSGLLEETLVELAEETHFDISRDEQVSAHALIQSCHHCLVF